jgi:hypothetical protein
VGEERREGIDGSVELIPECKVGQGERKTIHKLVEFILSREEGSFSTGLSKSHPKVSLVRDEGRLSAVLFHPIPNFN